MDDEPLGSAFWIENLKRLEAEDASRDLIVGAHRQSLDELSCAEERIGALEAALWPFADAWDPKTYDWEISSEDEGVSKDITAGDLRRARALLAPPAAPTREEAPE